MAATGDETPTLPKILELAIEKRLLDLHVSLPASVENYDGVMADVRPLLKRQLRNGTEFEFPVITNVPVIWPRTAGAEIHLPLAAGDTGTLLFCERSLDLWLVQGGCINPDDFRKHNLSDAQFIPGLKPFNETSEYDPDRLVIKNELAKMTLNKSGQFSLGNGVVEVMDLVSQLMEKVSDTNSTLSTATTNTTFGPMMLNEFVDFLVLSGEVDTIKAKWDTLKE